MLVQLMSRYLLLTLMALLLPVVHAQQTERPPRP